MSRWRASWSRWASKAARRLESRTCSVSLLEKVIRAAVRHHLLEGLPILPKALDEGTIGEDLGHLLPHFVPQGRKDEC
jgi:hypothetical protein